MLHSGFIGDKLGYRVILIIYILMSGAAATAFHFVPRCGEHKLQPHALLYNAGDTDEQGPNSIEKENRSKILPILLRKRVLSSTVSAILIQLTKKGSGDLKGRFFLVLLIGFSAEFFAGFLAGFLARFFFN